MPKLSGRTVLGRFRQSKFRASNGVAIPNPTLRAFKLLDRAAVALKGYNAADFVANTLNSKADYIPKIALHRHAVRF
jgi:hypothetical protein